SVATRSSRMPLTISVKRDWTIATTYSIWRRFRGQAAPEKAKAPSWTAPCMLGSMISLEQTFDLAFIVEEDALRRRRARQARHRHDLAADGDDEAGTGRKTHFTHRDDVSGRRTAQVRIGRERVLGL